MPLSAQQHVLIPANVQEGKRVGTKAAWLVFTPIPLTGGSWPHPTVAIQAVGCQRPEQTSSLGLMSESIFTFRK